MPPPGSIYIAPPAATKELNLNDEWRGRWVDDDELPQDVPVMYAYALVYMDDRGYATRPAGTAKWGMVETAISGDTPEAEIKQAVKDQTGGTVAKLVTTGYLECVATSHHATLEAGSVAVRPLYVAVLRSIKDLGRDARAVSGDTSAGLGRGESLCCDAGERGGLGRQEEPTTVALSFILDGRGILHVDHPDLK
jgi:hypothetical protein